MPRVGDGTGFGSKPPQSTDKKILEGGPGKGPGSGDAKKDGSRPVGKTKKK
jgi:hypothetical protein